MIKLTQSIWTALRGESLMAQAPTKAMVTATTLTVNWNWRNLAICNWDWGHLHFYAHMLYVPLWQCHCLCQCQLTESYTFLPHMTAFTMEEKLSSVRIMSDASLATSVPAMPIANPTSAFFNA